MLVDSHCHLDRLDLDAFDGQLDKALGAARENGVKEFLCVAIDTQTQADVIKIAESNADVFASVGVHPLYTEGQTADIDYLCEQAKHPKVIAIGETGLDFYYAKDSAAQQLALFKTHVDAAVTSKLPLIIHSRDARTQTLEILRQHQANKVGGVFHCFTESLEMAEQAIDLGFYISFSGIVTFKNAEKLREVARQLPTERILVETDSPYLTPVPHRGRPNSPRYVAEVARCLASIRGVDYEDFCLQTTENYKRLFF